MNLSFAGSNLSARAVAAAAGARTVAPFGRGAKITTIKTT